MSQQKSGPNGSKNSQLFIFINKLEYIDIAHFGVRMLSGSKCKELGQCLSRVCAIVKSHMYYIVKLGPGGTDLGCLWGPRGCIFEKVEFWSQTARKPRVASLLAGSKIFQNGASGARETNCEPRGKLG